MHRQEATYAQEGASHTTTALNSNIPPTNGNEEPDFTEDFNSDDGFMWMASSHG